MSRFAVVVAACIGAGTWALVLAHNGWIIPASFFAPLSTVVSVLAGSLFLFDAWAWRWPGIIALVRRPDLQGTWKGVVKPSSHTTNTDVTGQEIEVYVVIRQTYSKLHLCLLSPESQSVSLATDLIEEAPGQFLLSWIYRNDPRHTAKHRSPIHYGGGLLRVDGGSENSMAGHYWTDRHSSGELTVVRVSRSLINHYPTTSP